MFNKFTETLTKMKPFTANDVVTAQRTVSSTVIKAIPVPQIKEMTEKATAAYLTYAQLIADQIDKATDSLKHMVPDFEKQWKI